jgi:DNA polymerase III subunit alpha
MISQLNNFEVMEIFRNAKTDEISNFSDESSKKLLIKLQPNSLTDLCAIYSLTRNGVEKTLDEYCKNKLNGNEIKYIHPILDKHLNTTFGVIIYSEQIENILQDLANISKTESYKIRKELGKRNVNELEKYFTEFENGCSKNQVFLNQCKTINKDFKNSVKEIWDLLNDKIIETISFAHVLNSVSESYVQALTISRN